MFKMRREQMDAFRRESIREFEDGVARHVERCFPDRWAALGEGGVRQVIQRGVERAAVYGIVAERDVCKFIDLMLVFGADFDQERAWARQILEVKGDPFARMRRLHARALQEEA